MTRGPFIPTTIKSLASRLDSKINRKRPRISLIELSHINDTPMLNRAFELQYWPTEISLNKQVNMASRDILGGNLPLVQWTSGGEQTLTFSSVFTCDLDLLAANGGDGEVAARIQELATIGESWRNPDLRHVLAYFQRFRLGSYDTVGATGAALTTAPRKVLLIIPNSNIAQILGQAPYSEQGQDALICHVTQYDPVINAWFPSGLPRILTVSLGFTQSAQYGGGVQFPFYSAELDKAVTETSRYRVKRGT